MARQATATTTAVTDKSADRSSDKPTGNRPVHTVRHRRLRATIWKNQTEKGPIYNVTLSRSYRNGDEWRDSQSFSYDDLMNLAKVLFDAHSFISTLRAKERKTVASEEASRSTSSKK